MRRLRLRDYLESYLCSLTHRLAGLVQEFGGRFDTSYTHMDWHPHISDSVGRSYDVGEEVELNSIVQSFKKADDVKIIKQQYRREEA